MIALQTSAILLALCCVPALVVYGAVQQRREEAMKARMQRYRDRKVEVEREARKRL